MTVNAGQSATFSVVAGGTAPLTYQWQHLVGSTWTNVGTNSATITISSVAAADTGIWTAIFRDNRGPLLKALGTLQERLDAFKYALMTDDEQAIRQWWQEARERRGLFDAQLDSPDPTQDPAYRST